jgi:hypothetical protein
MGIKTQEKARVGFVVQRVPASCIYATCRPTLFTPYARGGVIGRWGALTGLAAPGARHPRYATEPISVNAKINSTFSSYGL